MEELPRCPILNEKNTWDEFQKRYYYQQTNETWKQDFCWLEEHEEHLLEEDHV